MVHASRLQWYVQLKLLWYTYILVPPCSADLEAAEPDMQPVLMVKWSLAVNARGRPKKKIEAHQEQVGEGDSTAPVSLNRIRRFTVCKLTVCK